MKVDQLCPKEEREEIRFTVYSNALFVTNCVIFFFHITLHLSTSDDGVLSVL